MGKFECKCKKGKDIQSKKIVYEGTYGREAMIYTLVHDKKLI